MHHDSAGISGDSIRLGQFLKLANLVDSGAEAKPVIVGGQVRVNGLIETRRGRQLRRGDTVEYAGRVVDVVDQAEFEDNLPW